MNEREQESWRQRIESFLASGSEKEVSEDGEYLSDLRRPDYRLEANRGGLLFHFWSPARTWARRVVGLAEEAPARLVLEVERFGRAKPGRLVIAEARRPPGTAALRGAARRTYSRWLRRLLEREFPGSRLEGLSTAPDLKRSFSTQYTRARLREGERWWAVLGVGASESGATADALLASALIWYDWNRQRYPERAWAGLRLFLPGGRTRTTANRLACLSLRAELYATDEEEFACQRLDPRDFGNLQTFLAPARRQEQILAAESSAVERIRALAPGAIEEIVHAERNELSLRYHGLEFARSTGGQVTFGAGKNQRPLTPRNFSRLEKLVERLREERQGAASPRAPYYRAQPERWLESLVRAAPQAVDPRLSPDRLYRQVPAVAGGERGVADLLGATREGQLVVIELKSSADLNLPMQALDYWMRVRWHHREGELSERGYFPGLALKSDPPELLLVAPALQFHPTTEAVVAYLAPEVRVTLIGLNEDWRRGVKVVWRRTRGAARA